MLRRWGGVVIVTCLRDRYNGVLMSASAMDVFAAAKRGDVERLRALVEQDAGLVHATDDRGRTLLVCAAESGHVEVARFVLDHGAAVNYRDQQQATALHHACFSIHAEVVSLLLQRGADVTAVDQNGLTPLFDAAREEGGETVANVLLAHGGSDVDAVDRIGWTAFQWALNEGHSGVLRQLLEAGVDPTLGSAHGSTVSDLAAESQEQECVTTLQEWERLYLLRRVRRLRDAPSSTPQQGS